MANEQIQALKAADSIIAEMQAIRRNGQCGKAIFTWKEFDALLAEREADKKTISAQHTQLVEERRELMWKIKQLEDALRARTLTVKLPESVIDAICLTAAEIHNLGRGVSDDRAQEIINSIRCAAGITLVVGGE